MATSYRKVVLRVVGGTTLVLVPACSVVAYRNRPRPSDQVEFHETHRRSTWEPENPVEGVIYSICRTAVLAFVTHVFSGLFRNGNTVDIVDAHKLERWVSYDRPGNVPLVTVANHSSTLDDPGLMSAIMPRAPRWQHRRMRWAICTEEICFSKAAFASFFGMGKALPVRRGGSMYQKGLATLQEKLNEGDWVHVFPEGRCWQEGGLPLRDEQGRWCSASGRCGPPWQKVGPFKWGVGKLVANSAVVPLVVPIYHAGMSDVIPQGDDNEIVGGPYLWHGIPITVLIGDPVPVADLIESYHTGARARAEVRNERRKEQVERLQSGSGGVGGGARGGGYGGWWAWLWPWGTRNRQGSGATPPAAVPRPTIPSLRPVNTVEDWSDHSGASAHIAGLGARRVTPEQAAQLLREEQRGEAGRGDEGDLLLRAERAADRVLQEAAEATARMRDAALREGESLRAQAHELVMQARDIKQQAQVYVAARLDETPVGTKVRALAAELESKVGELESRMGETAKRLEAKVHAALPPSIRVQAGQEKKVQLPTLDEIVSTRGAASRVGPRRVPTSDPVLQVLQGEGGAGTGVGGGDSTERKKLVELIPTRRLSTGLVVPAYVEAPLRICPPDHDYLTPVEAEEEEGHRLQLYSDIAGRLQDAVAQLERQVMARRAAQGIVERRQMS